MLFRELLGLLADFAAQQDYARQVPIANVPAELICMWFDDHYHPDSEWFAQAFSGEERVALAEFDRFYKASLPHLPVDAGIEVLQASETWVEVSEMALRTRDALAPE